MSAEHSICGADCDICEPMRQENALLRRFAEAYREERAAAAFVVAEFKETQWDPISYGELGHRRSVANARYSAARDALDAAAKEVGGE